MSRTQLLGAAYLFPAEYQMLNDVPFSMYLCTHGYFAFYHVCGNMLLRKTKTWLAAKGHSKRVQQIGMAVVIFLLGEWTAVIFSLDKWMVAVFLLGSGRLDCVSEY